MKNPLVMKTVRAVATSALAAVFYTSTPRVQFISRSQGEILPGVE